MRGVLFCYVVRGFCCLFVFVFVVVENQHQGNTFLRFTLVSFYIFCCWAQGNCAFIRTTGIIRGSVGGACINFTFSFLHELDRAAFLARFN